MLDLDDLQIQIKARMDATGGLSALHGAKTYFGLRYEPVARPHCRVDLIPTGRPTGTFGGGSLDYPVYSFNVFSEDLNTANTLAKVIGSAFMASKLSLTGQTHIKTKRVALGTTVEGNDAKNVVYRGRIDLEFHVQGTEA